jgi:hypothetical protein
MVLSHGKGHRVSRECYLIHFGSDDGDGNEISPESSITSQPIEQDDEDRTRREHAGSRTESSGVAFEGGVTTALS